MKISTIKIGRIAYSECRTFAQIYQQRLGKAHVFEFLELKDNDQAVKHLQMKPRPHHEIWVYDEKGVEWDTIEFSQSIVKLRDRSIVKNLTIVIGGPLGLSPEIRQFSNKTLSLSRLTLTSDIAFLVHCEQLYRAFELIKGTGYHHA